MSANPFDDLSAQVAIVSTKVDALVLTVGTILAAVERGKVEWEPIRHAIKHRKSRKILMQAINAGKLRTMRTPTFGGNMAYLLNRDDLDRLFPIRA